MEANSSADNAGIEHFDVVVVGAGLSGIDAGYRLQTRCPDRSYVILEGRDTMGGTWDLFRYPGIRSDSDMSTLGFPFEPWTSDVTIAEGGDICDYIRNTAEKYGIDKKIRYRHRVTAVNWDSTRNRWYLQVSTESGERTFSCNFLYSCSGYYNYANGYTPDFPEVEKYQGQFIHPQHWDSSTDVSGKNVVVIGSGATAITLVPNLTSQAKHVTMLQRTPTYVINLPKRDPLATFLYRLLPKRAAAAMTRWKNILLGNFFYNFSRKNPEKARDRILKFAQQQLGPNIDANKHFRPGYNPWDQRVCVATDGDLFQVLRSGEASIVTDRIAKFTADGILTESGEELKADIVISATGLDLQLFGGASPSIDGVPVNMAERMIYKGMMLDNVPNMAFAFGYTNASWTLKCDLSAKYVCRILNHMRSADFDVCVPREDAPVKPEKMVDMDSGYINRAEKMLPKQGDRIPWRVHQNYFKDLMSMRFARLEDNVLHFEKGSTAGSFATGMAAPESGVAGG